MAFLLVPKALTYFSKATATFGAVYGERPLLALNLEAAARWVLQNVYQHENLDVRQRVFKPNFVERDSVSPPG